MSDQIPPRPDVPFGTPPPPVPATPGAERPKATWRWWEAIGVYLLILIASAFITLPLFRAITSKGLSEIVTSAAIAVVNIILLVLWLQRFHPTWRAIIGFPKRVWPEIRAGMGFAVILYVAVAVAAAVLTALFQSVARHSVHTPRQLPAHLSAVGVIIAILYAVVIAPIHEELFFRGVLFRSLADRHGFLVGAFGSAVAFGLVHYIPSTFSDSLLLMTIMVGTGVGLAWFYERRGNIVADIAAHATFNVIGLTLIFLIK